MEGTNRPDDELFTGEWIREANFIEEYMELSHRFGNCLIYYELGLKSDVPLEEEQVKCALDHLYRKVPNLQACLGNREGSLWLKKATNPNVDFEVLQGLRREEVRNSLLSYRYNTETGPLFCARLLEDSPDRIEDADGLEPLKQHECYIFFGFHHSISDGTSNNLTMGFFISLLNDVISGEPIDDSEMGTFVSGDETMNLIMEKTAMIQADPGLQQKLSDEEESAKKRKPFLIYSFEDPGGEKETKSIDRILDQDTTSKFIQKCRQEKVTVNSAFSALANIAIVDLLVEEGIIQDSYSIQNFHTLNMRRYWKDKEPKTLGCHIAGPLKAYTETPKDLENFWDYASSLHKVLKDDLDSGKLLLDYALLGMTADEAQMSEEYLQSDKDYLGDYMTSNMGDVTPLVTEGGDHVRIVQVIRSSTIHLTDCGTLLNFHTFRGKLTIIFDYNTAALKNDIAERFLSQIVKRLEELV